MAIFRVTRRLSGVAPAEVIEFPVCVDRQYKVPDWKGAKVNQHPEHV